MQDHIVVSYGPGSRYTRHSEGAFSRLKDGRILFVYSRFTNTYSDAAPCGLAAAWSSDEGETWTEPIQLLTADQYGASNIMSVSLIRMQNGDLGLIHGVKIAPNYTRRFLCRSRDEGRTFYRRVECTLPDRPAYYVMNNDRIERLTSGRLLIPMAYQRHISDGRGVAVFLYSDDDGETWQEAPDAIFPPFSCTSEGLQEVGVIEKKDGALWACFRTDKLCQYESFSFDGGLHWTMAQPSRFTSPASPMKIKRHSGTGDLYAVWNPIPNFNGRYVSNAGMGRTPLVWSVSRDDGTTWGEQHVIEAEAEHGYCYPAVFFTEDSAMLVAYCAGGPEDGICLTRLTIRKVAI